MDRHDTQRILAQLESPMQALRDATPGTFAGRLAQLVAALEREALDLQATIEHDDESPEAALHRRALADFAALQARFAQVRTRLLDRDAFIDMLRRKGDDLDCLRAGLEFTGALDEALQHLIHLMQYDTPERHEVDIRNGFQFSSGSTQYQRFYFAPRRGTQE